MAMIVTGGAGFIGSNFLNIMIPKYTDSKFVNIDKLTYAGNPANLSEIEKSPNYSFIQEDICSRKLEKIIREGDIIVNFAAESHVDRSISADDDVFIKTNINGTHNLLEIARKNKAGLFLQISTDEVYGSLSLDSQSSKETDILKPSSPYSASKAAAEMLCMAYHRTYNLPVIITRSSNNYGPRQYPEKIIPKFITNLLEQKKVPLMHSPENPATNVRDWLYVDDNCNAINTVLKNGLPGKIYNIGGGTELSNIELTKMILDKMGLDEIWIEFIAHREGHDLRYSLDSTRIRDELCWQPKVGFEDGLCRTIEWYKQNESWWKLLKK
jgi:dTDP-glucose 4,6-dehydratase